MFGKPCCNGNRHTIAHRHVGFVVIAGQNEIWRSHERCGFLRGKEARPDFSTLDEEQNLTAATPSRRSEATSDSVVADFKDLFVMASPPITGKYASLSL